jgi:hypothetical protein
MCGQTDMEKLTVKFYTIFVAKFPKNKERSNLLMPSSKIIGKEY